MTTIDKSEILFIINPYSGGGNPSKVIKYLKKNEPNISFVVTKSIKEVEYLFAKDVANIKVVVVVGGDGTVNEVVKHLHKHLTIALAIFPSGSGNGFARELNFRPNIKSLINNILIGELIYVDLLEIDSRICINVAGLGFDSFVAHNFQNMKHRGLKSYITTIVKSIFIFKPFDVKIVTSESEIHGRFQMISIANTRQFGNNALISPLSKPNDGIYEIVMVKPFPFYYYPVFVIKMFLGTLKNSKYIRYISEKDPITIFSDFKIYHVDGDPYTFKKQLEIRMIDDKIKVIQPTDNHTSKNKYEL